jgi:hypothetical protein
MCERRRAGRALARVAIVVLASAAIAGTSAAGGKHRSLTRGELGPGFVIGSGQPALGLSVVIVDGRVASTAAADPGAADLVAQRGEGETQTTLNVRSRLDATLKYDLYVSRDGRSFDYASACAVTPGIAAFELWQYPVREFALGNVRVLPAGRMSCD